MRFIQAVGEPDVEAGLDVLDQLYDRGQGPPEGFQVEPDAAPGFQVFPCPVESIMSFFA